MIVRWWLALIVVMAWAAPARAEGGFTCPEPSGQAKRERAQAKALFEQALMLEPSDPAQALARLRCAETLAPRAAIALRIGTIEERLGNLTAAADAFERYLELAGEHAPDAGPMAERIRELRAQVQEQEAQAERSSSAESDGTQAVAGWVTGGSGLVLAIVGAALLGAAQAHSDAVHDLEPGTTAWISDEASGTFEQAEVEQTVGIVGLVAGGALLGVGVALVATAAGEGDAAPEVGLVLGVDGGYAGGALRVRF